jgi:hypothetical protein
VFEDHVERGKVTPMHLHADVDDGMSLAARRCVTWPAGC